MTPDAARAAPASRGGQVRDRAKNGCERSLHREAILLGGSCTLPVTMTTKIILASTFLLLLAACGDSAPKPADPTTAADAGATPASTAPATSASAAATTGKTYRLVVSFISKGAGTDPKARDDFGLIINEYRISKGAELKTVRPHWGKEGEMDICTDLTELSDAEKTKMIDKVRDKLGKNDRVTISENAVCHEPNK
jgi:hypothetical protein